eukprot:5951164-Pleurochrysis_carterae.AAC.1
MRTAQLARNLSLAPQLLQSTSRRRRRGALLSAKQVTARRWQEWAKTEGGSSEACTSKSTLISANPSCGASGTAMSWRTR